MCSVQREVVRVSAECCNNEVHLVLGRRVGNWPLSAEAV
jgi:hypothetical protein